MSSRFAAVVLLMAQVPGALLRGSSWRECPHPAAAAAAGRAHHHPTGKDRPGRPICDCGADCHGPGAAAGLPPAGMLIPPTLEQRAADRPDSMPVTAWLSPRLLPYPNGPPRRSS
ncbi:MAG: hypothetical protein R2882_06995 [Gemmatimonadales bacterium]